jgi:hypothetical protein
MMIVSVRGEPYWFTSHFNVCMMKTNWIFVTSNPIRKPLQRNNIVKP